MVCEYVLIFYERPLVRRIWALLQISCFYNQGYWTVIVNEDVALFKDTLYKSIDLRNKTKVLVMPLPKL
jgi:hypothetical protein